MSVETIGNQLLVDHENLRKKLEEIPVMRKITYRVDIEDQKAIGKPRFEPPKYSWDPILLNQLRDHLQKIAFYLRDYSYWYDRKLKPYLDLNKRNTSKKSIIFLLENDVYQTDEVYGAYLIEKNIENSIISYYRRDNKIQSFVMDSIDDKFIEDWIIEDSITQIKDQFNLMWDILATEIKTTINTEFNKIPKFNLTSTEKTKLKNELKSKYKKIQSLIRVDKDASFSELARLIELWYRIEILPLNINNAINILREAFARKLFNQTQFNLLNEIRETNNSLKHVPGFMISFEQVNSWYNQSDFVFV